MPKQRKSLDERRAFQQLCDDFDTTHAWAKAVSRFIDDLLALYPFDDDAPADQVATMRAIAGHLEQALDLLVRETRLRAHGLAPNDGAGS